MSSPKSPIGVFDSGVGGLTVLKSLATRFPSENFIYLGDTARLPYGTKSPATIQKYCEQNIQWLLSQKVKLIVIACNSASSHWEKSVWKNIPIYNVIDPGVSAALSATSNNRIGVLGTRATIESESYSKRLMEACNDIEVFSQACPLFVPLVEEGWIDDPLTNLVSYRYIQPLMSHQIDTLILGCTHYPVLREAILRVTGQSVTLIESGKVLSELLAKKETLKDQPSTSQEIRLNFTDYSTHLELLAEKLLAGLSISKSQKVDV